MKDSVPDDGKQVSAYSENIRQTVVHLLKPDADWQNRTFPDIVTAMDDVSVGKTVLRESEKLRSLKALETALSAAAQAYDQLGDPLQAHLNNQRPIIVLEASGEEWADLVSKESGQHICPPPITHRYTVHQLLEVALSATRLAAEQPINPMLVPVQKLGRTLNHAIRYAVWKLMEIFERATGIQPKANADAYAEDGYNGNFYPFAVACLAPLKLVPPESLKSAIRAAYREYKEEDCEA